MLLRKLDNMHASQVKQIWKDTENTEKHWLIHLQMKVGIPEIPGDGETNKRDGEEYLSYN